MSTEREVLPLDNEDAAKVETAVTSSLSDGGVSASWSSIVRIFAEAEPTTAAGAGGLLIVILLSVFGRIGSLIVGVIAGLLLHASLEKRRDDVVLQEITSRYPLEKEFPIQREVCLFTDVSNLRQRSPMESLRRRT